MVLGGLVLDSLDDETRKSLGIPKDKMALRIKHVGQYNEHAAAKRAGVQKEDILIKYDGRDDLLRETDVFDYALRSHRPGDKVQLGILRNGKPLEMKIPIQK